MQKGLSLCRGDFVLELDADDWLNENCLETLWAGMQNAPENVGMLYGDRNVYKDIKGELVFSHESIGPSIKSKYDMLRYLRGMGPRFYRKQALVDCGGWQVEPWGEGRLYEDISVILRLLETKEVQYIGYSGYNITKHDRNITHLNRKLWWVTMKKLVPYFIDRWGNEYRYVFNDTKRSVRFIPKSIPPRSDT